VSIFAEYTITPLHCNPSTLRAIPGAGGVEEAGGDAPELCSQAAPGELVNQVLYGDDRVGSTPDSGFIERPAFFCEAANILGGELLPGGLGEELPDGLGVVG